MQRTPRDINTPVPAFGRAGADLTRPLIPLISFDGGHPRSGRGRPSERRNTTESETVTGSNAQRPSLHCTERPYLFSPFYCMAAARPASIWPCLSVRVSDTISFPALRRAWDSRHIIPRPGYAFPVRARIQAGAVLAELCCVRRSAGTHDKHTAMRRKSFAYRRIV